MKQLKKVILIFCLLISFFILNYQMTDSDSSQREITDQETVNYQFIETFDNKTNEDASVTTAFGWGEGEILLPLKGFTRSTTKEIFWPPSNSQGPCYGTYTADNLTLITSGGGLAVFNSTNPLNPEFISIVDYPNTGKEVFLYKNFSYIAAANDGLAIINVTDPTNVSDPVYQDTSGYAYDILVRDDYAFVLDSGSNYPGLNIIDISDPTNPGTPISRSLSVSPSHFFLSGDYAFIADSYDGLAIIDVSIPSSPGFPIYRSTSSTVQGVHVWNNHTILSTHDGMTIIDVTDPENPGIPEYYYFEELMSGYYEESIDSFGASDIFVQEGYAYLVINGKTDGVIVVDVRDPANPGRSFYQELPVEGLYGIFIEKSNVFLAADGIPTSGGLVVLDASSVHEVKSPSIVQSKAIHVGNQQIHNITLQVNETVTENSSIEYFISFDQSKWLEITPNQTLTNNDSDGKSLYWRAVLRTNTTDSPVIDSILIDYEVYYDEILTTTNEPTTEPTTTEEPTTPITTTEPTTTIPPEETHNYDFSSMNEFDFSISTSLSSASTQIILNNLQTGRELQITVTPRLGQSFALLSISKTQSEIDWQLIDSQERIRLSVTQSNSETKTESMTIDTSGSWRLAFHWENSTETTLFDCNVKQVPISANTRQLIDLNLLLPLSLVIILLSVFGFVLYKTITVWSKEWQKKPEKETIAPTKRYLNSKKGAVEVKQLKRERETIETPIEKQIEEFSPEPTERRSFFCQLDNAQHPKTDSGYQCESCSRMVCTECYEKSLEVGVPECPFCDGTLIRIQ